MSGNSPLSAARWGIPDLHWLQRTDIQTWAQLQLRTTGHDSWLGFYRVSAGTKGFMGFKAIDQIVILNHFLKAELGTATEATIYTVQHEARLSYDPLCY